MAYSLLTPEEVSELTRVSKSTIYRWAHQGLIPHSRLGSTIRFQESEIYKWIKKSSSLIDEHASPKNDHSVLGGT